AAARRRGAAAETAHGHRPGRGGGAAAGLSRPPSPDVAVKRRGAPAPPPAVPGAGRRLGLLAFLLLFLHGVWCVFIPAGGREVALVELAPGTSAAHIAATLHGAGLLRSPLYFRALARLTRRPLQAGEYG